MSSARSARFFSIAAAFTLSVVFFLYQNFSEIRIHPANYQYQLIELQHLSPTKAHSEAFGINAKGEVMGQSMGDDGLWHTVRWSPEGKVKDLGVRTENKKDKMVFYDQPFSPKGVWIGPSTRDFGKREVQNCTGECRLLGELSEELQLGYKSGGGFLRVRGQNLSPIAPLERGSEVFPSSVNAHMEVVGRSSTSRGTHAFYWKDGKTVDLGAAKGGISIANDINDLGQIVGETLDDNHNMRPVLWSVDGDRVSALDLSKGVGSADGHVQGRASAINDEGEVVGVLTADRQTRPFLWSADRGLRDLNRLASDADPLNGARKWILEDGRGINNCGQIIGWGRKVAGAGGYSVLLKPLVSKPGCS
jgi:probable HAF family extracellular repeat protein